jgi:ribonuclease T2
MHWLRLTYQAASDITKLHSMHILNLKFPTTFAALLLCAAASGHGHPDRPIEAMPGVFDYYLMSLSWSPSYCETHGDETEQCGARGYGFVLHGLWPQFRDGTWPEHCRAHAWPDDAIVQHVLAFMPSRTLIEHEWRTHGACSGLDPRAYFDLADRAFGSIAIPPALTTPASPPHLSAEEIVQAFEQANPGLDERMIGVDCREGAELVEVRVCLSKGDLTPQPCGGGVRNTCRYGKLRIPASR